MIHITTTASNNTAGIHLYRHNCNLCPHRYETTGGCSFTRRKACQDAQPQTGWVCPRCSGTVNPQLANCPCSAPQYTPLNFAVNKTVENPTEKTVDEIADEAASKTVDETINTDNPFGIPAYVVLDSNDFQTRTTVNGVEFKQYDALERHLREIKKHFIETDEYTGFPGLPEIWLESDELFKAAESDDEKRMMFSQVYLMLVEALRRWSVDCDYLYTDAGIERHLKAVEEFKAIGLWKDGVRNWKDFYI